MAIELAPKKEERPLWQTILFYLSFVLLVLSLAVYLFIEVYYLPKINADIKGKVSQIEQENAQSEGEKTIGSMVDDVKMAKMEIDEFKNFYQNSSKASNFFPLFEGIVHPSVYFDSFSLTLGAEPKASLSGKAADGYESLIQQIEILKEQTQKQTFITSFEISNVVKAEKAGTVSFNLLLNLAPSIFKTSI
jgi:hypothetical protein